MFVGARRLRPGHPHAAAPGALLQLVARRRRDCRRSVDCEGRRRDAALLRALLLAVLCLLAPPLAFGGKHAKRHTCGRTALSVALADDDVAWVRRTAPKPRYAHCKVLSARYNCTRFVTSAAEYRLDWRPGVAAAMECALPTWATVLAALQHAPRRIMMVGDSHAQQMYQAAVCMFQAQARNIMAYTTHEAGTDTQLRKFDSVDAMPECHSVRAADFPRFHLDADGAQAGRCSLNHAPTTPSCFEVPLQADAAAQDGSKQAFSRVCSAYVRPLTGEAAVLAGLEEGLASLNMSLADFHVVAANTYVDAAVLGAFLRARAFAGRVVAYPKFNFGRQTGLRRTDAVLSGAGVSDANAATYRVAKFCAAIRAAWGTDAGECTTVQFGRLMLQRTADAKASIYPMSYHTDTGKRVVCHANQNAAIAHPERCDRAGVQACYEVPCAEESHFCLPGPPDDFALLMLASAL
jgi:hypothetical protein